ncbi:acetyltransferase [Colletotrichum gloeosporioides Cg-14]|uniref:Acetyltransferase n=1 Tax=Colletotrichum gloeosporioides (strain Cg-14) TaxID=1237896 RepID=T0MBH9_COLGC|nr:acetyltransferase [Colletotrichum gloeosporioides Cg-14]
MAKITIRDASTAEDDVAFIVAAFDSTLAPLAALGSGAMWGSTPFSQKDGFVEETIKDVRTSERYRATGEAEEALRIFVAEVELEDGTGAGAGLRCREAGDGRRKHAVEKGLREVYLDAWAGNDGGLVRYYEKHGFRFVAEFDMKRGDGSIWPGALVKMSCVDRDEAIV